MIQDRRQYPRLIPNSPLSVSVSESKSGLLFDLCEAGLAVDGLAPESHDEVISVAFDLPDGGGRLQSRAEIAWTSNSEHRIGVRFVDLAETSRQQLREWIYARVYPTELRMSERSFSSLGRDEWDNFVLTSGGSFLGCWAVLKARRLVGTVRLFEFFFDRESRPPQKVGQCAVAVALGKVTFLDRIHLKPAQRHLWDQCFKLIVQRFGANAYDYGSHWNHEVRSKLSTIPGFVTQTVLNKEFHLDLIDFQDWASFPAYRRGISENIRRDYRKAQITSARVETRFGLAALRDVFAIVTLRAQVMRKHKLRFSSLVDYFLHGVKLAVFGNNAFITTVRMKRRCYSAFFGIQLGSNLYYISGGTTKNRHGFGSYLFLTLIEDWFARHPDGKLVMGDVPGHYDPNDYTYGNLLYRRKLRVSSVKGVEFQLNVRPTGARDEAGAES
jgi:PilZ domain